MAIIYLNRPSHSPILPPLLVAALLLAAGDAVAGFAFQEATIEDIHLAFADNRLTSRQLTQFYLHRIETLNPLLRCVLEVNPDALDHADEADRRRIEAASQGPTDLGDLHGIPVLLKDSIGTLDKMNTTVGSYALMGAKVPRDATVVKRLRSAGAVILGKTSLTEWYSLRSAGVPSGWCARGGQAVNPYVRSENPCGSSAGSAIAVAANMASVSLGTETDSSILCPADHASIVGFKPTVELTSRAGVVPVSARQDTIGPMCRTVADAVHVLDAIVGFDPLDYEATNKASNFIPDGGYKQFLKKDGLRGKRLGIVRNPFLESFSDSAIQPFEDHLQIFLAKGAVIVDNLEITNIDTILHPASSGEMALLLAEFRQSINGYLAGLIDSPVKSLADIIAFNSNHPDLEKMDQYNQEGLVAAEQLVWPEEEMQEAVKTMEKLSQEGFEKLMKDNGLDAMVTLGSDSGSVMAIGGYPAITVPAGYDSGGLPFGICFSGLKGTEPILIEIAYSFEQATKMRRPPLSFPSKLSHPQYSEL